MILWSSSELQRARYKLDRRRGQYLENLKNRLGNIIEFVDIYECVEGFDILEWLESRCIVLSLTALNDEPKGTVLNDIIASIQDWMQQAARTGANLAISVDEAHRFFSPRKPICYNLGGLVLLDDAQTFRKQPVNLIRSIQVFRILPVVTLASVSTLLVFETSEGSRVRAVDQALSLDEK